MPNAIFEEPLEIEIGLIEAGPPGAGSYPYPHLIPASAVQKRVFRAAILENDFLTATFVPALGGRLLSIVDKRTSVDVLAAGSIVLRPTSAGRRGARLEAGIELHLDGRERLTSLAAVQFAAEEPNEDGPGGLWLAEAVTGTGLSWHLHVTVPEDRAELLFEARVFNRTYDPIPYAAGLVLPAMPDCRRDESVVFTSRDGNGIALTAERGKWSSCISEGMLRIARFGEPRMLAPRQLDTWHVRLIPFSGLNGVSAVSAAGAIFVGKDRIQIQPAGGFQGKVVLLTASGQSLEAPAEIHAGRTLDMPLPQPVSAAALMDAARHVVLKSESEWGAVPSGSIDKSHPSDQSYPSYVSASDEHLEQATFDVATRHIAHALLGTLALAAGDFAEAESRFEQSLLYNGEDHLTWWMKAMAKRLQEREDEESPELLNAHYLAPLDPTLRAESFLSQPPTLARDPSPILKPLDDYPETFVEVAALLVEARLFEQASRWIDEALRHTDLPLLRFLLAFSHLQASGLDFEAAEQIKAAAKLPVGPPYPWRPIEIRALASLAKRFPDDARLREWLEAIPSTML